MRRILVITTILSILLLTGVSVVAQDSPSNLKIDFSNGLSGWGVFGSGFVGVTTEQARSGTESLKMSGRSDGWHSASLDIDRLLVDGGTYKFSTYIRLASDTEEEVYAHFTVGENLADGTTNYNWLCEDVLISSHEWVLIESDPYTFNGQDIEDAWLYVEVSHPTADYYIDDFLIAGDKMPGEVEEPIYQTSVPALKDVLGDHFYFGAATSPHWIQREGDFISYHYGVLVAGNSMKPDALQPSRGRFNWRDADMYVEFAEEHDMLVRGHTLLWHSQVPGWFFQDVNDRTKPATREQLIETMENHIKTVVGRYKGRIFSWDVVNEVLNDSGNIRGLNDDSKWRSIIGDVDGDGFESDYIELAFKFAREADPDAQLIINDYGIESRGAKRNGMYNLIKRMLEKGIPVDGVGLQMHISIYGPSPSEIEESIELFASLKEYNPDFTVEVTEMDMSVYRWMEERKEITPELIRLQADLYGEIFEVFRRQAAKGNLTTVVMWGIGDNDSWLASFPIRGRGDAGLLFDQSMEPKPAYYKILQSDKEWYVTRAELEGALRLIDEDDQVIGNVLPGSYTIAELGSRFDLSNLNQIWLARGFLLEVFTESDTAKPQIYIGDDQILDLMTIEHSVKIIIRENTAEHVSLGKTADASHRPERAARAVDGQLLSSWSINEEPPYWISVDLEKPYIITNWVVYHRGAGGLNATPLDGPLNTSDFRLQISDDQTTWHDVDIVEGNVLARSDRAITPVTSQYVRLFITTPSSIASNQEAVIYEFEVYGLDAE